ncbi:MAG: hypothetical protein WKH64_15660 [Chloroflexia bacterium]
MGNYKITGGLTPNTQLMPITVEHSNPATAAAIANAAAIALQEWVNELRTQQLDASFADLDQRVVVARSNFLSTTQELETLRAQSLRELDESRRLANLAQLQTSRAALNASSTSRTAQGGPGAEPVGGTTCGVGRTADLAEWFIATDPRLPCGCSP